MVGEQDLAVYLSKFDKKYWLTYKVLDILQKVAYPPLRNSHPTATVFCIDMPVDPLLA